MPYVWTKSDLRSLYLPEGPFREPPTVVIGGTTITKLIPGNDVVWHVRATAILMIWDLRTYVDPKNEGILISENERGTEANAYALLILMISGPLLRDDHFPEARFWGEANPKRSARKLWKELSLCAVPLK